MLKTVGGFENGALSAWGGILGGIWGGTWGGIWGGTWGGIWGGIETSVGGWGGGTPPAKSKEGFKIPIPFSQTTTFWNKSRKSGKSH